MRTLDRERADALLDARPVRRVPEVLDAPVEDDDGPFSGFVGMLLGVAICLPLWAVAVVAVILFLR